MSLVVSFAQVLRLWRKWCQSKRWLSLTGPSATAPGLTKCAFKVCPLNRLLPSRVGEANTQSSSLLYLVCWHYFESSLHRLAHYDESFAGFSPGTVQQLPTSKNLLDGNSVFVPENMTPAKPEALSNMHPR